MKLWRFFLYRIIVVLRMGLLSEGSPLSWPETKKLADHVREHGITQFINLYNLLKDRQGDVLKWGDEVLYDELAFQNNLAYSFL